MSLINDALRKAKQSPKSQPPPAPFLTGEERSCSNSNLLIRGCLLLLALLSGAVLVWFAVNERHSGHDLQANARVLTMTPPPKPNAEVSMPTPKPIEIVAATPEPAMPATSTEAESPPAPAAEIPPASPEMTKPAWPNLQGIFFHPKRPSAVMDGRTVFAGELSGEFLVLAISKQSVTVSGAGQTNVLSLSD